MCTGSEQMSRLLHLLLQVNQLLQERDELIKTYTAHGIPHEWLLVCETNPTDGHTFRLLLLQLLQ